MQLRQQVSNRLLKPGADTSNIIQVYVCAIKALRHVDPSGVLLEAVSEPMRGYLKARADTVRQIVTSLTDPESSELLESSGGGGDADFLQDDHGVEDDSLDPDEIKGDERAMLKWAPDPVAADPTRSSYSRRSSDVLACLVNIYGSKALFVNEFRAMLADKLLSAPNKHDTTDREVRHLELLKKRFGETALHHCEVRLAPPPARAPPSPTPHPPPSSEGDAARRGRVAPRHRGHPQALRRRRHPGGRRDGRLAHVLAVAGGGGLHAALADPAAARPVREAVPPREGAPGAEDPSSLPPPPAPHAHPTTPARGSSLSSLFPPPPPPPPPPSCCCCRCRRRADWHGSRRSAASRWTSPSTTARSSGT